MGKADLCDEPSGIWLGFNLSIFYCHSFTQLLVFLQRPISSTASGLKPRMVQLMSAPFNGELYFGAGAAQFGLDVSNHAGVNVLLIWCHTNHATVGAVLDCFHVSMSHLFISLLLFICMPLLFSIQHLYLLAPICGKFLCPLLYKEMVIYPILFIQTTPSSEESQHECKHAVVLKTSHCFITKLQCLTVSNLFRGLFHQVTESCKLCINLDVSL